MQPKAFITPTDEAGAASGLVLRELHLALLRGIDGRGGLGSAGAEAPRAAKLAQSEAAASIDWTRRVSKVVLDSLPFAVDDDARVSSHRLPEEVSGMRTHGLPHACCPPCQKPCTQGIKASHALLSQCQGAIHTASLLRFWYSFYRIQICTACDRRRRCTWRMLSMTR